MSGIGEIARLTLRGMEGCICLMVPLPILETSLDESSDQKHEHVYCIGALLSHPLNWKETEGRWTKCLARYGIEYFRTSDCRHLQGSFKKLIQEHGSLERAREVANGIRLELESVLLSSVWIGFGLGVLIPDYNHVISTVPASRIFFANEPTIAAYTQVLIHVARSVKDNAPDYAVAFLTDDSGYSGKISDAFLAVKQIHPELADSMATIAPFDDKKTPSLQAADLLTSIIKDSFLYWSANKEPDPTMEKWYESHLEPCGIWDADYMMATIENTVSSELFRSGGLPLMPLSKKEQRRRAKQRAMTDSAYRPCKNGNETS